MARVTSQKNARQNGGPGNNRGSHIAKQQHKTNQKQKVVLEGNQGKGQGRNVVSSSKNPTARGRLPDKAPAHLSRQLSFHTEPPPGYTFIPAGNPQLTAALKEFAKRGNHKIFSVSVCQCKHKSHRLTNRQQTTPHASRHELSREVHRVGFHFPTFVVAQVCNHYGIRLTRTGRVIDEKENDSFMKVYQKGQLVLDEKIEDQVTINTEAKETIRDLFPNIPDNDLFQIIKTAFQLGDGKVGTADDVPLTRRASLSVVAHIRHVYTRYDKLLRRMPYNNARHEVEAETLKKLVEWRGDVSAESGAINDILDDVIVISDEDRSDAESEDDHRAHPNEVRVEELDHSTYWPAATARPLSPLRVADDISHGYRFAPHAAYRYQPEEIATRERNRAARWEQARQDYRSTLPQAGPSTQRILVREPSPIRHLIPLDPPQGRVLEREYLGTSRSGPVEVGQQSGSVTLASQAFLPLHSTGHAVSDTLQVISRPESPRYAAPQVRYERIEDPAPQVRYQRIDDGYEPKHPVYHAHSRPLTPLAVNTRRRSASPSGDRTIIQSIEGPDGAYSPTIIRHNENARRQNQHVPLTDSYRDRRDYQHGRSSPVNIPQQNPFGRPQHSRTLSDQYARDQPMQRTGSMREIIEVPPAQQRIILPEGDPNYHSSRNQQVHPRANPFQERPLEPSIRRLEPISTQPYEHLRTVHPATPPRRILEPIADDPYSDTGPQRYREYIPVTESYYGSAPSTSQYLTEPRRIVYANPPEEYITTTRYEPLPGR